MKWEEIIKIECEKICEYVKAESEKTGKDLGQEAVLDWIDKYAVQFREDYGNGY